MLAIIGVCVRIAWFKREEGWCSRVWVDGGSCEGVESFCGPRKINVGTSAPRIFDATFESCSFN